MPATITVVNQQTIIQVGENTIAAAASAVRALVSEANAAGSALVGTVGSARALRIGSKGTLLGFASLSALVLTPGAAASAGQDPLDSDFGTFTRATSTYEQTAPGVFSTVASGAGAYRTDRYNRPRGLRVAPAAVERALYVASFDNVSWSKTVSSSPTTSITADGTSAHGGTLWRYNDGVGAGTHRLSRAHVSVVAATGPHVIPLRVTKGNARYIQLGLSAGRFGTTGPVFRFDLESKTASQIAGNETADVVDVLDEGGGVLLCLVKMDAISTGNCTTIIYHENGSGNVSYTGDGTKTVFLHSIGIYAGTAVLPPIITTTAAVTRNADVWTDGDTADFRTYMWESMDLSAVEIAVGGFAMCRYLDASNYVAVCNIGGYWTLRSCVAGDIEDSTGPLIENGRTQVAMSVDLDNQTASAVVNGAEIGDGVVIAAGLTTIALCDPAGANQLGTDVEVFEQADGALTLAEMLAITGVLTAPAGVFDTREIIVVPSSTAIDIYTHLPGGAQNDWWWKRMAYRDWLAQRVLGWASDKQGHVQRIGEFDFTDMLTLCVEPGTADDDSLFTVGSDSGKFIAMVDETFNPSSNHGYLEAIETDPATFYPDGTELGLAPFMALGPFACNSFRMTQQELMLDPSGTNGTVLEDGAAVRYDATGKIADSYHEWYWRDRTYEMLNRKVHTTAVTYDPGTYLAQLYALTTELPYCEYREDRTVLNTASTEQNFVVTEHPFMRRRGDRFGIDFEIISGWKTDSQIKVQGQHTQVQGKTYHYYKEAADWSVISGEAIQVVTRQTAMMI